MQKILIIEDEASIADTILYALKNEGFDPVWCATGSDGLSRCAKDDIDLVILDIGLPDANGIEICRQLRAASRMPVIFLTSRSSELDRVVGLEMGADDYVAKPFSPRELAARVKAVLRRTGSAARPTPEAAHQECNAVPENGSTPFVIDNERMNITYFGTALELTKCEFRLLAALVAHPGRIHSRDTLKEIAWDDPAFSLDRTVDTHIKTLRMKLRAVRSGIDPIETRRGFGYALRSSW